MKTFYAALAVVALLGAVALAFVSQGSRTSVVTLDPELAAAPMAAGYVMGDQHTAKVEIVEFGDFECIGCGAWFDMTEHEVKEKLVKPGIATFRFYDFPLQQIHPHALSAHVAAGCAAAQNKFWEMHDRLYTGQSEWNAQGTNNPKKVFQGYVKAIGVDMREWNKCYDERRPLPQILANQKEGERLRVSATPTLRIGNKMITGNDLSFDRVKVYVDSALADTLGRVKPPPPGSASGRGGK